jgi:hypothetical protein
MTRAVRSTWPFMPRGERETDLMLGGVTKMAVAHQSWCSFSREVVAGVDCGRTTRALCVTRGDY